MVRHGLTIAGGYLAHRGWIDQDTAASAVAPIAEQIVGFAVAGGAAGWAALRARGDCQDFRVRAGIMGTRSFPYVTTQRTDDTERVARSAAGGRRGQRCL
ncbi:MAG: hypothetical protein ACRYGI_05610 [Janthinobacterium lividum]